MTKIIPIVLALLAPVTRRVRSLERRCKWVLKNGTLCNEEEGPKNGKENA